MLTPQMLWSQYHQAIRNNDLHLAEAIMQKIQSLRTYPQTNQGCGSCRRRF